MARLSLPQTTHFKATSSSTCHGHGLCHSLEFMALHSHPYRHQPAPQLTAAAGYADSRLGTGEPRLSPDGLSLPSKSTPSVLNWGVCEVLWGPRGSALDFAKRETKASVVPIRCSINCNQTRGRAQAGKAGLGLLWRYGCSPDAQFPGFIFQFPRQASKSGIRLSKHTMNMCVISTV